ncbi:MAG: ATP-binding protein [Verrucomicrobiota bacterium]
MSFAPFIPLAGCFFNALLATFIFARSPRSTTSQVFLLSGFSIAIWNLGSFFLLYIPQSDTTTALFWARFLQFGVLFEVAAFVHLSLLVAGLPTGKKMVGLYVCQTLLAILNCTPWYISGVQYLGNSGWYAVAGPAFHLLNIPYAISLFSIVLLFRKRRSMSVLQRQQVTPILYAQTLLALFGINDLLPIIGINHYPLTHQNIYPYGSLAAVFYVVVVAYGVLQNQFLDARVDFTLAAAQIIRFSFLFIIASGLLLGVAVLTNAFTPTSLSLSLVVFMLSTITASLFFPKLFASKSLEKWERHLLGDRFEQQDQAKSFIDGMPRQNNLTILADDLHNLLIRGFGLQNYQLIIPDDSPQTFGEVRIHPPAQKKDALQRQSQAVLLEYFEKDSPDFLTLNAIYPIAKKRFSHEDVLAQLHQLKIDFCFPLSSDSDPYGLLLVGAKSNGQLHRTSELKLLLSLVKAMSPTINQIRLKSQVLQAQELDLLGRMSRGMAHDLNNLLTPVWTLLQLSIEESDSPKALDLELLPVAMRNIKTMRAYIREALFFSENLRLDLHLGRLDLVIQQAVDQASQKAYTKHKKNIDVSAVVPKDVLVEMDEVLILRLISNLISNAIDASPSDGQIKVHLTRFTQTNSGNWLRIRVVDQGEGIPKENLPRILKPYFTTKNRGDETRGFGLGLAISRKITNLHGGNLSIASTLKKGTTVQVDIPARQSPTIESLANPSA